MTCISRFTPVIRRRERNLRCKASMYYHYAYTPVGGERAASYTAENLKKIYPDPDLVKVLRGDTKELRDTDSPAVYVELGYRGNPEDEMWMKEHVDAIAKSLVMSLTQFLNQPFVDV